MNRMTQPFLPISYNLCQYKYLRGGLQVTLILVDPSEKNKAKSLVFRCSSAVNEVKHPIASGKEG